MGQETLSPGKLQGCLRRGVQPQQLPGSQAAAAAGGGPGLVLWAGRVGAVGQGPTAALGQASRTQLERPPLVPASCSDLEYSCFECSVTRWLRHTGDPCASPGPAPLLGSRDKGPTRLCPPELRGHKPWQCHTGPWKAEKRQKVARGSIRAGASVQFRLSLQRASRGQAGERKRGALGRRRGCNRSGGEASLSSGSKPGQPLLPHSRA